MAEGEIRIIAGAWRGRKLKVPDKEGLRPTPNRVRETLFNWLAPQMPGSYCLDAFAGSGALGFEALSRGAAHVVMVDHSADIVRLLKEEMVLFKAENADIYRADVPSQLKPVEKPFTIVFLDPPFKEDILLPTCFFLEEKGYLASEAFIYLEAPAQIEEDMLPVTWKRVKCKKAGQVVYHLFLRTKIAAS